MRWPPSLLRPPDKTPTGRRSQGYARNENSHKPQKHPSPMIGADLTQWICQLWESHLWATRVYGSPGLTMPESAFLLGLVDMSLISQRLHHAHTKSTVFKMDRFCWSSTSSTRPQTAGTLPGVFSHGEWLFLPFYVGCAQVTLQQRAVVLAWCLSGRREDLFHQLCQALALLRSIKILSPNPANLLHQSHPKIFLPPSE